MWETRLPRWAGATGGAILLFFSGEARTFELSGFSRETGAGRAQGPFERGGLP